MMQVTRVDLPLQIEQRLKNAAAFVDTVTEFGREELVGFRRPLAATFAYTAPVVLALMFHFGGWPGLAAIGAAYCGVTALGLYILGKRAWPSLVKQYEARSVAQRKAAADLKCGFGEAAFISLPRPPTFIEYDEGVLVLADAGDFRTLFFSIERSDRDPRWALYCEGELHRRVWRWLRLPVSREIAAFSTEGTKLAIRSAPLRVDSIDAWEAINAWLGEPEDGAVIHRALDDLAQGIEAMI